MLIYGSDRRSQLSACIAAAHIFLLGREAAIDVVNTQVRLIEQEWSATCDEAHLSQVERNYFWRRQFLNPFAFYGASQEVRSAQPASTTSTQT
jgi:serine/threonine-protein kinase HipA